LGVLVFRPNTLKAFCKKEWISDDRIYDLQGRRLDIMPENGVYIRGGKKYLIMDN